MNYTLLQPVEMDKPDSINACFAHDVLQGFSHRPKFLPSKYFYDANGSRLFQEITELEEYYPTRCEAEILARAGGEIAQLIGNDYVEIVELGAGDGRKTKLVLRQLDTAGRAFTYVPVDISEVAVAELTASLHKEFPQLSSRGLVGEYFDSLDYLKEASPSRKLVMFLGSNIGNFDCLGAKRFLRAVWSKLHHGDFLLIGFDLKKNIEVMLKAYNDSAGVTSAFNYNVLRRINRELGANFDLQRFSHYGNFNPVRGAMESYLLSTACQQVEIEAIGKVFEFEEYEPIHLEYSYKYLQSDIDNMAREGGFEIVANWYDSKSYFVDSLWKVIKSPA